MFGKTIGFNITILLVLSLVSVLVYKGLYYSLLKHCNLNNPIKNEKPSLLRIHKTRKNMTTDKTEIALELDLISKIVQDKLSRLQNTVNCSVPHVVCGHRSNCGFGCHVHHRIFCLMLGFTMNRSLIFNTHSHLSYKSKWSDMFSSMGVPCNGTWDSLVVDWGTNPVTITVRRSDQTIQSPINEGFPFPHELAERLRRVHTKPYIWLVGQFAKFAMKLLPEVEKQVELSMKKLDFKRPIVGIHVRRTDKMAEQPLSYHPIQQYMEKANEYFEEFHPDITEGKRVYIATEDSDVFDEIMNGYQLPDWHILGFPPRKTTENLNDRMDYLFEIILDVILLSRCDFVVCGFTSNICRLVYELMQTQNEDAIGRVYSLDKTYYFNVLGNTFRPKLVNISNDSTFF